MINSQPWQVNVLTFPLELLIDRRHLTSKSLQLLHQAPTHCQRNAYRQGVFGHAMALYLLRSACRRMDSENRYNTTTHAATLKTLEPSDLGWVLSVKGRTCDSGACISAYDFLLHRLPRIPLSEDCADIEYWESEISWVKRDCVVEKYVHSGRTL
jgi:hypothetical protein